MNGDGAGEGHPSPDDDAATALRMARLEREVQELRDSAWRMAWLTGLVVLVLCFALVAVA